MKVAGFIRVRYGFIKGVVAAVDIYFLIVADVCGIHGADIVVAIFILLWCHCEGQPLIKISTAFNRVWRNRRRGAVRSYLEGRTWPEPPLLRCSCRLCFSHLHCYRLQNRVHERTPVEEALPRPPPVFLKASVHMKHTQGCLRHALRFLFTQETVFNFTT